MQLPKPRVLLTLPLLLAFGFPQEQETPNPGVLAEVTVSTLVAELPGGTGGLEVDAEGFVYSADFGSKLGAGSEGGNLIFKIDPKSGEHVIFNDSLRGASGNAIGPDGNFYQSNVGAGSVTRITPKGKASIFCSKLLKSPVGIAIDAEGTLFVANCNSGSITEISSLGEASSFATSPLFSCPNGIALDEEHNLYVANFSNGDVLKVDWNGEVSTLATLPGNNNGHVVYREGFLYVVARSAHQIYRVSLAGEVSLLAGSGERGHRDGPALEASFSYPNDLAFSPDGKTLYVNENARIEGPGTDLAPMTVRSLRLKP